MNTEITFNQEYHKTLTLFTKALLSCLEKENKHILLFKTPRYENNICISKKTLNTLFFFRAKDTYVSIPDTELGICHVGEFLRFVNAVGYPKSELSSIKIAETTNSFGQLKRLLIMANKTNKYYVSLARPGLFSQDSDKLVPPPPEKDPLVLVAKISLTVNDIKELSNNISLLGDPEIFGISIESDSIKMYVKDKSGEKQYTKDIDPQCLMMNRSANYTSNSIKVFPTSFLHGLSELKSDFVMEIRYLAKADILSLKSRAQNINDDMEILVATQESRKHTNITDFDVITDI